MNFYSGEGKSRAARLPAQEETGRGDIDYMLLALVLILYGIGVIMVFSSSVYEGLKLGDHAYFFKRQVLWAAISLAFCIIFGFVDCRALEGAKKALVWGIIILLVLLLLPRELTMGLVHPSRRWFKLLGVGFQPSEFAKVVLIIYLSSILSKKGERIRDFYRGFLPPFFIVMVISFLVLLQPDFSTAFLLFFISMCMFFIAGIRSLSIVSLLAISIPVFLLLVSGRGYRADRIMGYINPWADPTDKGYQIIQSFRAFAYGGFGGAGIGNGVQKLKYLPIPHTDFIYAVIAEEMGFIGALLVIFLYMVFAFRGFSITYAQGGNYEFFLGFGITSTVTWSAVINIAVVTGLLPSTGMTLPFISYGGSSLLANSILAGLLLNLSRNRRAPAEPLEKVVWAK